MGIAILESSVQKGRKHICYKQHLIKTLKRPIIQFGTKIHQCHICTESEAMTPTHSLTMPEIRVSDSPDFKIRRL